MIEIVIISAAMAFAVIAAHLDRRDQQRQEESFRSALERLREQYRSFPPGHDPRTPSRTE